MYVDKIQQYAKYATYNTEGFYLEELGRPDIYVRALDGLLRFRIYDDKVGRMNRVMVLHRSEAPTFLKGDLSIVPTEIYQKEFNFVRQLPVRYKNPSEPKIRPLNDISSFYPRGETLEYDYEKIEEILYEVITQYPIDPFDLYPQLYPDKEEREDRQNYFISIWKQNKIIQALQAHEWQN
jgi:hypothetical protein